MASRIRFSTLVLSVLIAAPPFAHAEDVYKCTVNGATVYQGMPCANGRSVPWQPVFWYWARLAPPLATHVVSTPGT